MSELNLNGSCLCGAVAYQARGEATRFYHCHCQRCRKASGTGHATNLFLQPGTLSWVRGEERLRSYKVPQAQRFTNVFCDQCGGRLPRQPAGSDIVVIPAGSLDDDLAIAPRARIFCGSRAGWSCGGDALPAHAEYPPP